MNSKIKEVALKHNITISEAERIFYHQFHFVAKVIKEDSVLKERRTVKLPRLGTFYFSKNTIKYIEENVKKRKLSSSSPEDGDGNDTDSNSE